MNQEASAKDLFLIQGKLSELQIARSKVNLLEQIPQEEPVASISADGAFDTKCSHQVIAARHAQAVIPVRKNGRPWKEKTVWGWGHCVFRLICATKP